MKCEFKLQKSKLITVYSKCLKEQKNSASDTILGSRMEILRRNEKMKIDGKWTLKLSEFLIYIYTQI